MQAPARSTRPQFESRCRRQGSASKVLQVGGRVDVRQHARIVAVDDAETIACRVQEVATPAIASQGCEGFTIVRAEADRVTAPAPVTRGRERRTVRYGSDDGPHGGWLHEGHVGERHDPAAPARCRGHAPREARSHALVRVRADDHVRAAVSQRRAKRIGARPHHGDHARQRCDQGRGGRHRHRGTVGQRDEHLVRAEAPCRSGGEQDGPDHAAVPARVTRCAGLSDRWAAGGSRLPVAAKIALATAGAMGGVPGFADAAHGCAALHQKDLDPRHRLHAQDRVVVEVALLDAPVLERDPTVEGGREPEDDAGFHLRADGVRVDDGAAVDGAHHAMDGDLARRRHRDFRHLRDEAAEGFVHGDAHRVPGRQLAAPAGAFRREIHDAAHPRMVEQQQAAIRDRILLRRRRAFVDEALLHEGGEAVAHGAPPEHRHAARRHLVFDEEVGDLVVHVGRALDLRHVELGLEQHRLERRALDDGLADDAVLPRDRQAVGIEPRADHVVGARPIVAAAHVVLARPDDLDRNPRRLRDLDRFLHEVGRRDWRDARSRRPGTSCG